MTTSAPTTFPSLGAMAADAAARFGPRLAVADGDTRLTYQELFDQARAFAAALVETGVEPGDRVGIWAYNSAEWIVAALGLLQAGAAVVPVNTRFKVPEVRDTLARTGAKVLVAVTDFLGIDYTAMLRALAGDLPALERIIIARGPAPSGWEPFERFCGRASTASLVEVDRRRAALGRDDVADILFTSGTTGVPKGVVMTHGRTLHVAADYVAQTALGADDRYLMINPYFHMFGLKAGILASVAAGAAMLPVSVLDVDAALERIAAEGVTVLPGPPTLFQMILDHPGRHHYDLSSLRVAVIGAADVPVELVRRIHDELPFSTILSGYGLTEAGTATGSTADEDFETIATTAGRPRPGVEIRVVDKHGDELTTGEVGQVVLRSRSVMLRYLDDPDATAAALSPDGWLQTGDLGAFDDAGRLRIVGRVKDMFIVGGFNVYPAEVENALLRHPAIAQAAVVGVPDDRLGEVGMAFVVRKPGGSATAEEITAWAREEMANYKVPRFVEFVDQLPTNATGKVQKPELRVAALQILNAPNEHRRQPRWNST